MRGWDDFWFRPVPASTLALLRIGFAGTVLLWSLTLLPDVATFYGPHGLVAGSESSVGVFGLVLASSVSLLAGYRTRASSVVLFAGLVWLYHADPWILNSGDDLMRDLAFLLLLSPAGAAFSVDRLRAGGRLAEFPLVPAWPLRLVQLQLSLMYLASVAAKLGGSTWRDGTAVSYPLRLPAQTRLELPATLVGSPALVHALTWGTLAAEASIGLLLWSRRARPWVLGLGVVLHVSIALALRAGFFSWIVLVAYLAFVPPETAERLLLAPLGPARRQTLVPGST